MLLSEFLLSSQTDAPFLTVLGHPVSHSLSPRIHQTALDYHNLHVTYHAVDCPAEEVYRLPELFASKHFMGANVTIPLKQGVITFLDELDQQAGDAGAVNTVVPASGTSRLTGHNTDIYGFMKPLETIVPVSDVTVLGTGGASRAVTSGLLRAGTERLTLVSRSGGEHPDSRVSVVTYEDLADAIRLSGLIVNTTPVGMHPDTGLSPVPENLFPELKGKICYDIIYNPLQTRFLVQAQRHGAQTIGGLDMFLHQAARAFELWFQKQMPLETVRNLLLEEISS